MTDKSLWIRTGDLLFRWRNLIFPLLVAGLCLSATPASSYLGSADLVHIKDLLAVMLVVAGLLLRALTIGLDYICRGGRNRQVFAERLVTGGLFQVCRNPLYVGNVLIYSGIFALHGHPWVVVAGLGLYVANYAAIIAAEEYFLAGRFGDAYRRYCAATPRWLPDWSRSPCCACMPKAP